MGRQSIRHSRARNQLIPNIPTQLQEFPGHIACSSDSKSEIVLPAFKNSEVALALDIDSNKLNDFDETDREYLRQAAKIIERIL